MSDPQPSTFQLQLQRLHRLTVLARWSLVVVLWLSLGSLSIWGLRREISLWLEHFTWVAVWYALRDRTLGRPWAWGSVSVGLPPCWSGRVVILFGECPIQNADAWNINSGGFALTAPNIPSGNGGGRLNN